jgi:NAD(P)-dependent dehydrogenase (short-subunit alcohol dehydrogenase family)
MDISQARHAFITGGASGIGLGIADALLKRGVAVTVADNDEQGIAAVVAARAGQRIAGRQLDVRDVAAFGRVKAEAEAEFGPVDILVANAGIGPDGEFLWDATAESLERLLAINVGGIFNAISAFAGDMRDRRSGYIVVTGSMAGLAAQGFPRIGTYTASKYAVVGLSEVLRHEMAPYGVGVSTLCPGMVASNLGKNTTRMGFRGKPLDLGAAPDAAPRAPAMDPADVGERTVAGIIAEERFIITHPGDWAEVGERSRALEEAFRMS